MKLSNILYRTSKSLSIISSILREFETISSGNSEKISRHFINKAKNRLVYNTVNKIDRLLK